VPILSQRGFGMPPPLKLAVVLFNQAALLDFLGPIEQLGFLQEGAAKETDPVTLSIEYLGPTREPIKPSRGPAVLVDRAYGDVGEDERFDILLLPGGLGARPHLRPPGIIDFIRCQAQSAKYVLGVCTGSWLLADAGVLDGKRATTNKAAFRDVKEKTSPLIDWVPKARWVVDGNVWTSSGVTAGLDMTSAFIEHLAGKEKSDKIRGIIELSVKGASEDEFAEWHGLV